MALNSSGPLSLGGATTGQSINLELGQAATALASINAANFRTLAGVASGQISISNFYGKSSSVGYYSFTLSAGPSAGSNWAQAGYLDSSGNVYFPWRYFMGAVKLNAAGTVQWAKSYTYAGNTYTPNLEFVNSSGTTLLAGQPWTTVGGIKYNFDTSTAVGMIVDSSGSPSCPLNSTANGNQGGYANNNTTTVPLIYSLGTNSGFFAAGAFYNGSNPGFVECGTYYPGDSITRYAWGYMHFRVTQNPSTAYDTYVNIQGPSNFFNGSTVAAYTVPNTGDNWSYFAHVETSNQLCLRGRTLTTSGGGLIFSSYTFKNSTNNYITAGQLTVTPDGLNIYHGGVVQANFGLITKITKATVGASTPNTISAYSVTNASYTFSYNFPPVLTTDSSGNMYVGLAISRASTQNATGFWIAKFNSSFVLQWQRQLFKTTSTITGYTGTDQQQVGFGQMNVSPDGLYLNCFGFYSLSYSGSVGLRQGLILNLPVDGSKTATITVTSPNNSAQYIQLDYAVASSTVSVASMTTGSTANGSEFSVVVGNAGAVGSTNITGPVVALGNW